MIHPTRHVLSLPDVELAYLRWGEPSGSRPVALLLHGLGHTGSTWRLLAAELAATHTVYAPDRRGHGRSGGGPTAGFAFSDFASDLEALVDALELDGALGVGHSAGATDLLLAAGARPRAFSHVVGFEPTVQDPDGRVDPDPTLSSFCQGLLGRTRGRPGRFRSLEAARAELARMPFHRGWQPEVLDGYLEDGVRAAAAPAEPDAVELSCTPDREAAMLTPVFQVMENRYPGREFVRLRDVRARVLGASGGDGRSVFAPMATVAARVVPGARLEIPDGATHFWPHERPDQLAALVRSFTRD